MPRRQQPDVLVVEPNPDLRAPTCDILIRSGYTPAGGGRGRVRWRIWSRMSDPSHADRGALPGGVSGTDWRAAPPVRRDLRVLVTSGAPDEAIRPRNRADGSYEFWRSPIWPPIWSGLGGF